MNKKTLLFILCLPVLASAAEDPVRVEQDRITQEVRSALTPELEETLRKHCGDDCPGFKVNVAFKAPKINAIDDLGFAASAPTPEQDQIKTQVASVSVTVLVRETASEAARNNLKKIVDYRARNLITHAVRVALEPLNGNSPAEEKDALEQVAPVELSWVEKAKPFIWPACLVTLMVLAVSALAMLLRHRRRMFKERILALQPAVPAKEEAEAPKIFDSAHSKELLEGRTLDLQWLIEERTSERDQESLQKILSLFTSQELTARMELSSDGVFALAQIPVAELKDEAQMDQSRAQALAWLKLALDRAHWQRLAEERDPLAKINRLTDDRLVGIFRTIQNGLQKAAVLSVVKQDRWPSILSRLGAEERIEMGISLSKFQKLAPAELHAVNVTVQPVVDQSIRALPMASNLDGIVEDFSLFLSEKEGQRLWQELTAQSNKTGKAVSMDALVRQMNEGALLEVLMSLEFSALKNVFATLSDEGKKKALTVLPASLKSRLESSHSGEADEATQMQARAKLASAYRKFNSGSVH